MRLNTLSPAKGAKSVGKRRGRGHSAGQGKTCGRGQKGQHARSGGYHKVGFEGGQMPLVRRMPKRGFANTRFRRLFHVVNVRNLETVCLDGAAVTVELLADAGLIRDTSLPLKVLGDGELSKKLDVTAAKFSESARKKIEAAGGTVTVVIKKKWTRPPRAKKQVQAPDKPVAKAPAKKDKTDKPEA